MGLDLRAYIIEGGTKAARTQVKEELYRARNPVTSPTSTSQTKGWRHKKESTYTPELQGSGFKIDPALNMEAVVFSKKVEFVDCFIDEDLEMIQAIMQAAVGFVPEIPRDQINSKIPDFGVIKL